MTVWLAVYTRARAEKTAQEHLRRQGYKVYLPRHLKRRRHARTVPQILRERERALLVFATCLCGGLVFQGGEKCLASTGRISRLQTSATPSRAAIKYMVELYSVVDGFRVPGGAISINREIVTVFASTRFVSCSVGSPNLRKNSAGFSSAHGWR